MADLCAPLTQALDSAAAVLDGGPLKSVMDGLGAEGLEDIDDAVRADLGGDLMFSGWRNARLTAGVKHVSPGAIQMAPKSKGIGPFTVAQYGRNPGTGRSMGPQLPKVSKKTGKTSRAKQRFSRWNGSTLPKHTWDDATAAIGKNTPERARKALVAALTKQFKI